MPLFLTPLQIITRNTTVNTANFNTTASQWVAANTHRVEQRPCRRGTKRYPKPSKVPIPNARLTPATRYLQLTHPPALTAKLRRIIRQHQARFQAHWEIFVCGNMSHWEVSRRSTSSANHLVARIPPQTPRCELRPRHSPAHF